MFETVLLQKVIDAWITYQESRRRDVEQKPAPDIQDIRMLMETAFLASLEEEEGRATAFSITLLQPEDVATESLYGGRKRMIKAFDRSLALTVESITKLAPAFDPKTTSFIVAPTNGSKTEYQIWGVIFFKARTDRFEETAVDLDEYHMYRPDTMIVHAISRGSLIIARGGIQLGRFVKGNFLESLPTPLTSTAMGSFIINVIQESDNYKKLQVSYWQVYRDTLDRLIRTVSSEMHGGTIILVPKEKVKEYAQFFSKKYAFREELSLAPFLMKLASINNCPDIISKIGLNHSYANKVDYLARLACIDGALIITRDLEVVSFGATLRAPKWEGKTVQGPDGYRSSGGNLVDISKLGTRHNSTVNFIGACPGCIGFVISRDGPVMGLAKGDENTVLCWRDMRVSMFV